MPTTIQLDELQDLIPQAAILVDVLPADEYTREHLPGAINIPLKTLNRSTTAALPSDRPIITYCHDFQ
ncbi:MAG TPA: rhodanese-like domain-containing protein [Chloroflexota bacterium]|nr:rhodanese-like domain-containing protein [Chloroflexota bacterium]